MSAATAKIMDMVGQHREPSGVFEKLEPPRMAGASQSVSPERIWQTAIEWIDSNRGMVYRIAGSEGRNMMAQEDLLHHAYLVAHQTIGECLNGGEIGAFVGRFVDSFRLSVIFDFLRQNRHVIEHVEDIEALAWMDDSFGRKHLQSPEENMIAEESELAVGVKVEEALQFMTGRQQRFWQAILSTPGVRTVSDAARLAGIGDNKGRDLVQRSLARVRRAAC